MKTGIYEVFPRSLSSVFRYVGKCGQLKAYRCGAQSSVTAAGNRFTCEDHSETTSTSLHYSMENTENRQSEGLFKKNTLKQSICVCIYIYIYIYIVF